MCKLFFHVRHYRACNKTTWLTCPPKNAHILRVGMFCHDYLHVCQCCYHILEYAYMISHLHAAFRRMRDPQNDLFCFVFLSLHSLSEFCCEIRVNLLVRIKLKSAESRHAFRKRLPVSELVASANRVCAGIAFRTCGGAQGKKLATSARGVAGQAIDSRRKGDALLAGLRIEVIQGSVRSLVCSCMRVLREKRFSVGRRFACS